jgi:HTH-type transcriptional regulator, global nitrogen regulator NrpRI
MKDYRQQRNLAILSVFNGSSEAQTSAQITDVLVKQGHDLSERTVRLYLKELDTVGWTQNLGRRGRVITEEGRAKLGTFQTYSRVGLLSAKIDQMTYEMTFDLALRTGTVVVNTTLVDPEQLRSCIDKVCRVFEAGYAMGNLVGLLGPGERIGDIVIPEGKVGFCPVCSITLNGVLLKHGVPTRSRFGGLMGLKDGKPMGFLEMIDYDGTTIDPLEVFIRSAMTNYLGAIEDGNGLIGASFREVPAGSRALVVDLAEKAAAVGLGGFMEIGQPGQSLFNIPVSEGRVGAVVIGGLNPVAILEEMGFRVVSRALSGLLDFNRLLHYEELKSRI